MFGPAGRLRTCEGVHERGQRPVEHLEEGVSAGVLLRPAQHRVLQDVRDPRAVQRSGSELDAEGAQRKRSARELAGQGLKQTRWCAPNLKRLLESSLAAWRY